MEWLFDTLRKYPELAIFLTLGLGYWIGAKKIFGFNLGAVTGTLLVGVLVGQLDITIAPIAFIDQHLSETAEQLRAGHIGPVDVAIIEAAAITETGAIVPTMSVGNSASFAQQARCVIIELNLGVPAAIEGLHDIYVPADRSS